MIPNYREATKTFGIFGIICMFLVILTSFSNSSSSMPAIIFFHLCSVILIVVACSYYAKGRGHSPAWGFLGLLSIFGLILLLLLDDKNKHLEEKKSSNPLKVIIIGVVVFLSISVAMKIIVIRSLRYIPSSKSNSKYIETINRTNASLSMRGIYGAETSHCRKIYEQNKNQRTKIPLKFITAPPLDKTMPDDDIYMETWNNSSWKELDIEPSFLANRFVYEVKPIGKEDDAGIRIIAEGDLNGDGKKSTIVREVAAGCCEKLAINDVDGCWPVLLNNKK